MGFGATAACGKFFVVVLGFYRLTLQNLELNRPYSTQQVH